MGFSRIKVLSCLLLGIVHVNADCFKARSRAHILILIMVDHCFHVYLFNKTQSVSSCEYISFWRPIPQEGYSCAGYVAWTQRGPPPQRLIMCLHDSCTEPALCNPGDRHPLWCDTGIHSKFGDISLWPLFDATVRFLGSYVSSTH